MARILLGCIIGRAPTIMMTILQYLGDALDLYHTNKDILVDLRIHDHLNIPKFHSMVHYIQAIQAFGTTDNYNTEMFEHFHIDCAKEGCRASNFQDELPQMTHWLERQEKVAMFETYLQHFEREEGRTVDNELAEANHPGPCIVISKKPIYINQSLTSIQKNHHCPSFSHQLCVYLNGLLDRSEALPRSHVPFAHLPFGKFGRDALGNDIDRIEEWDWVKAKPGRQGAAAHTDEAESTGMKRMKIGRLRYPAPQEWSIRGHLAYIEWYKLSSDMSSHHNMYTVHRPLSPTNGVVEGDMVPLHTIQQSSGIAWLKTWNTNTVLDKSHFFLLNNWSSKYAYQTL
ncbi:hypothetical protein BDR04DRAFT_1129306 [Suillus decipiens]|nr:hypothetical protein BDR04DRAFT_1129306 [Suillus decipiens]